MTRSRRSAKTMGTAFETNIARYLAAQLDDDRIERRARNGAKDRGDIAGVQIRGRRLVIECKNCVRLALPTWIREAQIEAGNDDALTGVVISKRSGTAHPGKQWVHLTVDDLIAIITGMHQ
jgi:hypothetical protein